MTTNNEMPSNIENNSNRQDKEYIKQFIRENNPSTISQQKMNKFLSSSIFGNSNGFKQNQHNDSINKNKSYHTIQYKTINVNKNELDKDKQNYIHTKVKESIKDFAKHRKSMSRGVTPLNKSQKLLSKSHSAFDLHQARYSQYNTQDLCYKLYKEYSKIKFANEEDFLSRMDLYATKKALQQEKLDELLKQNIIRVPEDERVKSFNRLIEDSNKRIENMNKKEAMNKLNLEKQKRPKSANVNKSSHKNNWNKIYKERFYNYWQNSLKNIEELRKEQKENEEKNIQEQMKYLQKSRKIKNKQELDELNKKLYYQPQLLRKNKKIKGMALLGREKELLVEDKKNEQNKRMNLLEERMKHKQNQTNYAFGKSTNDFDKYIKEINKEEFENIRELKSKGGDVEQHNKEQQPASRIERLIDDFFENKC